MRILVSGAAGFIGSHTVDLLQKEHHKVLAVDNFSTGKLENLKSYIDNGGVVENADVLSLASINKLCASFLPDCIIHLAAQAAITTSIKNPVFDLSTNAIGTLNMVTAAKKFHTQRFVMASTSAVYQEDKAPATIPEDWTIAPQSPYGISKAAAEMYIRVLFRNHAILRYGNVYGPRQEPIGDNQVIARAIRHFVYGDEFSVNGDGKQKRDFVYVEDVAFANMQAAQGSEAGTFNVSSGESRSVMEILGVLEQVYEVVGYPWTHNENKDPRRSVKLRVSEASRKLNWKALVPLSAGLRETAQWWKNKVQGEIHA